MLAVKDLTYSFKKKKALDCVNFQFSNQVYGLLGPNGSGKTTLMRCITGLYPLKQPHIYYNDAPAGERQSFSRKIGYLPQKFGMYYHLTLTQMLLLIANMKGLTKQEAEKAVPTILEQVNLQEEADKKVKALSGGMVRRAGIAQALIGNPEILLFDEPTTGLDPEERMRFQSIIAQIQAERTILISTHIVEDVQAICDQVIVMHEGKVLAAGSREEIADHAREKTYTLPLAEENQIQGEYYKQKQYAQDGVPMIRVVSNVPQSLQKANPTVEDGYICYIKGI